MDKFVYEPCSECGEMVDEATGELYRCAGSNAVLCYYCRIENHVGYGGECAACMSAAA